MTFILAPTAGEAVTYTRKRGLLPRSWCYLHAPWQLSGADIGPIIRVGNWSSIDRVNEMMAIAARHDIPVLDAEEEA